MQKIFLIIGIFLSSAAYSLPPSFWSFGFGYVAQEYQIENQRTKAIGKITTDTHMQGNVTWHLLWSPKVETKVSFVFDNVKFGDTQLLTNYDDGDGSKMLTGIKFDYVRNVSSRFQWQASLHMQEQVYFFNPNAFNSSFPFATRYNEQRKGLARISLGIGYHAFRWSNKMASLYVDLESLGSNEQDNEDGFNCNGPDCDIQVESGYGLKLQGIILHKVKQKMSLEYKSFFHVQSQKVNNDKNKRVMLGLGVNSLWVF